jgi:uncharacterized protein DUF397
MDDLSNAAWHKSSYSGGNGGECVEVAVLPDARRAVRDSKDPDGGTLVFDTSDWLAFIKRIQGV